MMMLIIDITRINPAIDPNSGITITPLIEISFEPGFGGMYSVLMFSTSLNKMASVSCPLLISKI